MTELPTTPSGTLWRGKMFAWLGMVAALVALNFASRAASEADDGGEPLFEWTTAVAGAVFYAIMLGVVLLIARGPHRRELLGLHRPASWKRAVGATALALVVIWATAGALGIWLDAGEEQGLVPDEWDSDRLLPYAANFAVVAGLGPVVEELSFRGLGYATVAASFGVLASIIVTALAFGLVHGLVLGLPVLIVFGLVLAILRQRTGSVYPAMAAHGVFNGIALLVAVLIAAPA